MTRADRARFSRAKTERVAAKLNEKGFPALPFHAGLDPMLKRDSLTRFRSGEPLIVVATIAFGMGIDRPDVRFVAHLDMPDSPEAYYQQIGRAGRDGDPADTLLLFGGQDVAQARHRDAGLLEVGPQLRHAHDRAAHALGKHVERDELADGELVVHHQVGAIPEGGGIYELADEVDAFVRPAREVLGLEAG
jgi:superfamily II DNA helicase RecQ